MLGTQKGEKVRTWAIPVIAKRQVVVTINVKSQKKDAAKAVARAIVKLLEIYHYKREYTGVLGVSERESVCIVIGGSPNIPQNASIYQADVDRFLKNLPPVIDEKKAGELIEEAKFLFKKHIFTEDKRETPKEYAAGEEKHRQISAEFDAKRKAEELAFVNEWCLPEKIQIPEGMMSVYLEITFDDSDMGSDYFSSHRQVGQDMLLGIVHKQNETERTARSILAVYPELSSLNWQWKTEKYSMGHGNYLISEWTKTIPHKAYDGRTEVKIRFEIRFGTSKWTKEMYPYKNYKGTYSHAAAA